MTIQTTNIEKLEKVFHALNQGGCNICVQPSSVEDTKRLWTICFSRNGDYAIGQGDTLANAVANLCVPVGDEKKAPTTVQEIDQVAA